MLRSSPPRTSRAGIVAPTRPRPAPSAARASLGAEATDRPRWPFALGLVALTVVAFGLRAILIARQSSYMDETAQVLMGRTLIEQGTVYADALAWSYGSYLWPLVAGAADIFGGLTAVRLVTAVLGTVMALATAAAAYRLAPATLGPRRRTVALIAGTTMALFPTAIGVSRIATYDVMAAAPFMCGVALLIPGRRPAGPSSLITAMALLFTSFLAKYVIAIFFPFICLYLLFGPRDRRIALRNVAFFVLPLSVACALYFAAFHDDLIALLTFSTSYTDLRSNTPFFQYVGQRLDVWMLAAVALAAWPRATPTGRFVAFGGAAIMLAFQAMSRADHDFWKHSIYLVFFLAPPAALLLAPLAEQLVAMILAAFGWRQATGTERVVALGLAAAVVGLSINTWPRMPDWRPALYALLLLAPLAGLALLPLARAMLVDASRRPLRRFGPPAVALTAGLLASLPIANSLMHADHLVAFYPNLNPSVMAIRQQTADARVVLTDDSAVRYYLYNPDIPGHHRVVDPFYIEYKGQTGIEGYRSAVTDRYFDAIILDGGIGPVAAQIRGELGELIAQNYQRVYARTANTGAPVEIFRPRERAEGVGGAAPNARVFDFAAGVQGWGGRPENSVTEPGFHVSTTTERTWDGRPTLRFDVAEDARLLGLAEPGPVSKVTAQIYIVPADSASTSVRVGMVGFDWNWQWRDDSFVNEITPGRWTEITWTLTQPGVYREIGIHFPPGVAQTAYIGRVEVQP